MADWWLIPEEVQERLSDHLWNAIDPILAALGRHHHETGVVGALGQALMDHPLQMDGVRVTFDYRKFPERSEEFATGADGSFVVTITPPNGSPTTKAALFQAKLFRDDVPPADHHLNMSEAGRFSRQVRNMAAITDDGIGLLFTMDNIYVVDAGALADCTARELCRPLRTGNRLITLETYLGKWLPRCTRGDQRLEFVKQASTPGGFRHRISMNIVSNQPLLPLEEIRWSATDRALRSHLRGRRR